RNIAKQVADGTLSPDEITEQTISDNTYFPEIADCDLIIRPSGEYRLSNFLLWQSAYSEFWFSDVLWPDFSPKKLDEAILAYQHRNRRFGGL
ncbi:MAG: undecaprenyl diphosphate synthase family protein, partial [Acutalibacteraceae bacterium]